MTLKNKILKKKKNVTKIVSGSLLHSHFIIICG